MNTNITTKDSITKLTESLKNDENYYDSWVANIAMAFLDEFYRTYPDNQLAEVKNIANKAADNFIKQLIS